MSETNANTTILSVGNFLQTAIADGESLKLKINRERNELTLIDASTGRSAKLEIDVEIEDEPGEAANEKPQFPLASSSVEELFQELASGWRKETAHLSLVIKKVVHPAYQRIIGLGPAAIPSILRELQRKPGHWSWALKAITGEDPTPPDANVTEAAQAWLQWGRERHYI
jgi:hypothetical protein